MPEPAVDFHGLFQSLNLGLFEREKALAISLLALFCGEHLFYYGPPGVAKSLLARRLHLSLQDSRHFEYLMGRFSVPEEIFGPFSLSALKDEDKFQRKTQGYLPEADIAFLDEIWRSSSPIQNSLLTILNERVFRNGVEEKAAPLKTLVAAANSLPQSNDDHQAIWDRFLFRLILEPIQDQNNFAEYLNAKEESEPKKVPPAVSETQWQRIQKQRNEIALPPETLNFLSQLRRAIQDEQGFDFPVSDRRWKKTVTVLKTAALMEGREPDSRDFHLLEHILWSRPQDIPLIRKHLMNTLKQVPILLKIDLEAIKVKHQELVQRQMELFRQTREEEQWVPELFQEEYLRCREPWEDETVQIWKEDWDNLTEQKSEGIELILLEEKTGTRRIETVPALKLSENPPVIRIEDFEYSILAHKRTVQVEDHQELSPEDQDDWDQNLKDFEKFIQEQVALLVDYKKEIASGSGFFPKESYWIEALTDKIDQAEKGLIRRLDDLSEQGQGGKPLED
jgi:MoxR-like ATPase